MVREGEGGGGGLAVQVQAAGEGVHVGQASGAGGGDPLRISASFHHRSRRDKPSSDTARATIKKISFKPTSPRSPHAMQAKTDLACAGRAAEQPSRSAEHPAR